MKKGILLFGYVITMAFVWIWGFLVLIMAASLTTIESDLVGPFLLPDFPSYLSFFIYRSSQPSCLAMAL